MKVIHFGSILKKARILNDPAAQLLSVLTKGNADKLRHAQGRSLQDHLLGTCQILRRWGQDNAVQIAGLCHSLYSTDRYRSECLALTERDRVRSLIGYRAEQLAYWFCSMDRKKVLSLICSDGLLSQDVAISLPTRVGWKNDDSMSKRDLCDLGVLLLANAAEQGNESVGALPGPWLAHFSQIAKGVRLLGPASLPEFVACFPELSRRDEDEFRSGYEHLLGVIDELGDADKLIDGLIDRLPVIGELFVWQAYVALRKGKLDSVKRAGALAVRAFEGAGFAWDKRLKFDQWVDIARQLRKGGLGDDAGQYLHLISRTAMSVRASTVTGHLQEMPGRFSRYLIKLGRVEELKSIGFYPDLPKRPVYDPKDFPLVRDLEDNFDGIRSEVDRLDFHLYHEEAEDIARKGSWKVFMLYEAGRKNEKNCRLVPTIASILESHESVRRLGGLVYLSRLHPNTRIAPHRGGTNMRLRCHLGVRIPEGNCAMRVGSEELTWRQGKCIVFDDSFEHEVWNDTEDDRIVLLIDIWHPDLTKDEIAGLNALNLYGLHQGYNLVRYWERNRVSAGDHGGLLSDLAPSEYLIDDH